MSNTTGVLSPAQPSGLTLVTFNAREPGLDRDALDCAMADASAQLDLLPAGRVLRVLETSKLARRISAAATQAGLRPRLVRVVNAVVQLTVHYSRLVDEVSLGQLAYEAGFSSTAARKLGADLAELAAAGVLLYRPGRGRGRMSTIGVPARFASDVLLRLQREGRWTPPTIGQQQAHNGNNAGVQPGVSTGLADVVGDQEDDLRADLQRRDPAAHAGHNVSQNSPGRGGVSDRDPSSYVPKEPSPPSSASSANTASSKQTRGSATSCDNANNPGDNLQQVRPADVDWILTRLPAQLKTTPGSKSRYRLVAAVRQALAEEFRRGEILARITHALPAVVDSAAGFVGYRLRRLMACSESPRVRGERDQGLREADQAAHHNSSATRANEADWQARVLTELGPEQLAMVADLARTTVWRRPGLNAASARHIPSPTGLAHTVSAMLRTAVEEAEPGVSTLAMGCVRATAAAMLAAANIEPVVLGAETIEAVDQAPTLVAAMVALCRPNLHAKAPTTVLTPPPALHEEADHQVLLSCVACGDNDGTVQPRVELPRGSAVCTSCYAAAVEDTLVVDHVDGKHAAADDLNEQPWWAAELKAVRRSDDLDQDYELDYDEEVA